MSLFFFLISGLLSWETVCAHFTSEPACNEWKEIHQELKRFPRWGELYFSFFVRMNLWQIPIFYTFLKKYGTIFQSTAQPWRLVVLMFSIATLPVAFFMVIWGSTWMDVGLYERTVSTLWKFWYTICLRLLVLWQTNSLPGRTVPSWES